MVGMISDWQHEVIETGLYRSYVLWIVWKYRTLPIRTVLKLVVVGEVGLGRNSGCTKSPAIRMQYVPSGNLYCRTTRRTLAIKLALTSGAALQQPMTA